MWIKTMKGGEESSNTNLNVPKRIELNIESIEIFYTENTRNVKPRGDSEKVEPIAW